MFLYIVLSLPRIISIQSTMDNRLQGCIGVGMSICGGSMPLPRKKAMLALMNAKPDFETNHDEHE